MAGKNGEWLSISAAARHLGISRQALQFRIKRGGVMTREDNRGNPQVFLPVGVPAVADAIAPASLPAPKVGPAGDDTIPMTAHREIVEALERVQADLSAALHRQVAAERRRANVAEEHLAAELTRRLTLIERLTGRRIYMG